MRTLIGVAIGLLVLGSGHVVYAGCTDEQAVINARAAADATCTAMGEGCSNASNHGAYVKCVAGVANTLSSGPTPSLPKNCKGAVKKCAAHSTCGKSGEVTCCFAGKSGPSKCKNAKSAADCTAKGGTSTFDPTNTSCCSNTHPLTDNACMASPSGAFLN